MTYGGELVGSLLFVSSKGYGQNGGFFSCHRHETKFGRDCHLHQHKMFPELIATCIVMVLPCGFLNLLHAHFTHNIGCTYIIQCAALFSLLYTGL